jgi:hypothetical protein
VAIYLGQDRSHFKGMWVAHVRVRGLREDRVPQAALVPHPETREMVRDYNKWSICDDLLWGYLKELAKCSLSARCIGSHMRKA